MESQLKTHHVVAILSRLLAVYLIAVAIGAGASLATMAGSSLANSDSSVWLSLPLLLYSAVMGALILFLWAFPLPIARAVVPRDAAVQGMSEWTYAQALDLVLILAGLIWLVKAGSKAAYWSVYLIAWWSEGSEYSMVDTKLVATLVAAVFEMLMAAWLVMGVRGWRKVILRLRKV